MKSIQNITPQILNYLLGIDNNALQINNFNTNLTKLKDIVNINKPISGGVFIGNGIFIAEPNNLKKLYLV